MQGSVGLEVMNSTNPEVNWKTVTKGRRSRKSAARSFNAISKAGNSISPNRVGDFSGSDSDKFNEAACGQSTSGKSESVPIKKRRHLLQTPPGHQESSQTRVPFSEDHEQLLFPSGSSGKGMSTWQARGIDSSKAGFGEGFDHILLCEQAERRYNELEDFSGIELLAAAASMDDEIDNDKEDLVAGEEPLEPKISNTFSSAAQSELPVNSNKSENSSSNMPVNEGSVACSNPAAVPENSCQIPLGGGVPKVNRQHWDLNTLMDAWDEPFDDSLAGNTSKDVDDSMHMEGGQKVSIDPVSAVDEASNPKMEEHNASTIFPDRTCSEMSKLVKNPDPSSVFFSGKDAETSNQVTDKGADGRIPPDQILSNYAHKKALNQVLKTDATMRSDGVMSNEILSSLPSTETVMKYEDCSGNLSKTESSAVFERIEEATQDINVHGMPTTGVSQTALDYECNDVKGSQEPSESPAGTCIQDIQSLITDSKIENDGTPVPDSTNAERQGLQSVELIAKHEDTSFPNEGLQGITIEDSCKSSSAAPQCDGLSSSVGKIESAVDTQLDSDVSQDNHFDGIDGNELTRFDEGYDSPYEDGELRASYSYSWEDNELENECVDYESDGRNGDGPNPTGYRVLEIVEDGSHGTQNGSSYMERLSVGSESKTGPVRHSMRRYFAKDDSDNNERAGKGSNAGSGTTVEQSMDMDVGENDDIMKRRQLTDGREAVDVKMAQLDEFTLKTARGKLRSRIEGRSSLDVNYGKDVFFAPPYRPRRLTYSYSRPEREMSPDKHLVRYRPATHGEREGDRPAAYWSSRRRYESNYQSSEGRIYTRPRSINGDSDKVGGLDVHDPRQTANYFSRGPHRPLMRSPSERDDYFGVRKRIPLSRGVSSYRSRGHYSQRVGRDFREDLEPLPDDSGAPVRFSRYISRRDRSFSPGSGRTTHMPLPRRKSRSRSRTRSPGPWRSNRERVLSIRRHSRSPDFRPEPRMERMRMPFPKPTFAPDYGEDYINPLRGRFSPQRNHPRWVEDHTFPDNHVRRRRSPGGRVFKRSQRFDSVGSSGRLKSDEYFRPMLRPGRFSFKPNGICRDYKFENSYDGRRCGDGSDTMHHHRAQLHSDDGANIRRFRHNAAAAATDDDDDGNFETSNMNKDDPPQVTDVPPQQTQVDGEDKRSFKI